MLPEERLTDNGHIRRMSFMNGCQAVRIFGPILYVRALPLSNGYVSLITPAMLHAGLDQHREFSPNVHLKDIRENYHRIISAILLTLVAALAA